MKDEGYLAKEIDLAIKKLYEKKDYLAIKSYVPDIDIWILMLKPW